MTQDDKEKKYLEHKRLMDLKRKTVYELDMEQNRVHNLLQERKLEVVGEILIEEKTQQIIIQLPINDFWIRVRYDFLRSFLSEIALWEDEKTMLLKARLEPIKDKLEKYEAEKAKK